MYFLINCSFDRNTEKAYRKKTTLIKKLTRNTSPLDVIRFFSSGCSGNGKLALNLSSRLKTDNKFAGNSNKAVNKR